MRISLLTFLLNGLWGRSSISTLYALLGSCGALHTIMPIFCTQAQTHQKSRDMKQFLSVSHLRHPALNLADVGQKGGPKAARPSEQNTTIPNDHTFSDSLFLSTTRVYKIVRQLCRNSPSSERSEYTRRSPPHGNKYKQLDA